MVMFREGISESFKDSFSDYFIKGVSEVVKDCISDFYMEMNSQGKFSNDMNIYLAVSLYAIKRGRAKDIFEDLQVMGEIGSFKLDLPKYLSQEKINVLLSHYTEVIDYCLDFRNNNQRSYNGFFSQPKELVQFCTKLMGLQKDAEVYYPFAGMGSFAVENPSCYFTGEEISPFIWALQKIYLDAHNISSQITIGDSFFILRDMKMCCDNIILTPPFSLKNSDGDEFDALSYALGALNGNGKLLAILPSSFCFSSSSKCANLRQYLVDNHYLSTVVTLPNIYYPFASVTICILLIEKVVTEEPKDSILLVDGRSFVVKNKKEKNYILDADGLLKAISSEEDKSSIIRVSSKDVDGNDNLSPDRYLLDTSSIKDGVKLHELIAINEPHSYEGDMWIVSNFSDDWHKCDLTLKKSDNIIKRRVIANEGNCMMVQYSNSRLMIGVVNNLPIGEKVAVGSLAIAFHIKDSQRISEKYLLYALKSKVVTAQAQARATGTTIPRLSSRDFLDLVIPCPSPSEQDKIIHEAEDKYLQQLGLSRTTSDIAHMLGTPSVHIGNALKLLSLSKNLDEDDKKTLNYLKDNFEYMDRLVKLNSIFDFSKLERKPICLADFIKSYILKWKSFGSNTFSISFDGDENALKAKVSANSDALMIMFDCLFDNANRHGFHKTKTPDNELAIVLLSVIKDDVPCLMLRVGNNGTPLAKDFTLNDYITRGRFLSESGRSGLGGYHVNAVVQSMGGEMCPIISSVDWTAFEFRIPIINVDELEKSKFLQQ
jgi:type I restriction enzyme M protein